jgi:hypothetical protein
MDEERRKHYEDDLAAAELVRRQNRRAGAWIAAGVTAAVLIPLVVCTAWGWADLYFTLRAEGYEQIRIHPTGILQYAAHGEKKGESCGWSASWAPGYRSRSGLCTQYRPPTPAWMLEDPAAARRPIEPE